MRLRFQFMLFGLLCSLLYALPIASLFSLIHIPPTLDWQYFDELSHIISHTVWASGVFPLHDPTRCGGLDLLTNPQNRLFSPMGFLDLLLNPHAANTWSLLLLAYAGLWGGFLFFKDFRFSPLISATLATLFVGSSWFGLHLNEGHIPFGYLQLLPWSLWFLARLEDRRSLLAFGLLHAFFLLSGGIYAFIFSLYLCATALTAGLNNLSWSRVWKLVRNDGLYTASVIFVCALMAAPKIIPTVYATRFMRAAQDPVMTPHWKDLLTMFFYPFQHGQLSQSTLSRFQFHELGSYWGIVQFLCALSSLFLFPKKLRALALSVLFWLWCGTGVGGTWNPWSLHTLSPLQWAHVQPRTLLLAHLFLLLLVGYGIQALNARHSRLGVALIFFLLCETIVVFSSPFWHQQFVATTERLSTGVEIQQCYETSFRRSAIVDRSSSKYRGFISPLDPQSHTALFISETRPGQISFQYALDEDVRIVELNTNHLHGWTLVQGKGEVVSMPGQRLRVRLTSTLTERDGLVTLQYWPDYIWSVLIAFFLGWCGLGVLIKFL